MTPLTRILSRRLVLPILALITLGFFAVDAKASLTGICDPDAPGACAAPISVSVNVLTISLTHTSPPADGGLINAVAFNLMPGTTVTNFTTTNADFALFEPGGAVWTGAVSPDGTRASLIGATGNDYNGGGRPSGGSRSGGSVVFTLTPASLNRNTEQSIFSSFLVGQRGLADDGSDKDGLVPTVSEPLSLLLLGSGLVGSAAGIRRRRRNNKSKSVL